MPWQVGHYVPRNAPMALSNGEEKRRPDVQKSQYGRGTPTLGSGRRDHMGLAEQHLGSYQTVATEQGVIKLPIGETDTGATATFIPSSALLSAAPYADSRYPTISDRYFK